MNTNTLIPEPSAFSFSQGLADMHKPLIIAGPCSAETPEQLMAAAQKLALNKRVDYFRAGIWKPRTSPGSFQGVGAPGLEWLQEVKRQTGMGVCTEIGSQKHLDEALAAGIDMVWIGARTVSNPFLIQEIADALRGVDIPILVKNPLSPDIDLWEGALKRFSQAGVRQLGAIHRGFFWWGKSQFRNQPFWHIPLELRRRMPELPLICDPSHIAGKRSLVPLLAQRAVEQKWSGLMIEVHPDPDQAWSDAAQQLCPEDFDLLMQELFGSASPHAANTLSLIEELRAEVDIMDEMLVWALSSRMELASQIARVKREAQMEPLQPQRWAQVINRVQNLGSELGLRSRFVEKLFNAIHKESLAFQEALLKTKSQKIEKQHNFAP